MRNLFVLFIILSATTSLCGQTETNPFAKHGLKKVMMATSSKGEFKEFHYNKEVVEIGSILYNTKTKEVIGYIDESIENDVTSATPAMSIDPNCEKYYWISPYAYCLNNPVRYVDPDGRDVWDFLMGFVHSVTSNLSVGAIRQSTNGMVSNANHYNAGRTSGDVVSVGMGISEMVAGGGTAAGGAVATVGTVGTASPVSVPAAAAGVGVAIHGAAVTGKAAASLMSQDGRISQAEATRNSSSSESSSSATNTSSGKTYSEQTYNAFEKQLKSGGEKSLLKSKISIEKNINEHVKKLDEINKNGGYSSSIEREIKTFRGQLDAIDNLLKPR